MNCLVFIPYVLSEMLFTSSQACDKWIQSYFNKSWIESWMKCFLLLILCWFFCLDDETRLVKLREICVATKRTEADFKNGTFLGHLRFAPDGCHDCRFDRHAVHHGFERGVFKGKAMDPNTTVLRSGKLFQFEWIGVISLFLECWMGRLKAVLRSLRASFFCHSFYLFSTVVCASSWNSYPSLRKVFCLLHFLRPAEMIEMIDIHLRNSWIYRPGLFAVNLLSQCL